MKEITLDDIFKLWKQTKKKYTHIYGVGRLSLGKSINFSQFCAFLKESGYVIV